MTDYLQSLRDKTILVTGGAGAIGSNLAAALATSSAARVIVLDDLSSAERWSVPVKPNVLFVGASLLDEAALKRVFGERPQIVYHLAAFFANQNSVDHPERDLRVNGMGTLRVLEYSVLAGVERFIYAASSSSLHSQDEPLPLGSNSPVTNLSTPYQITKLLGELYCSYFFDHYGLKTVRPRLFNSYGPGEMPGQYRNVIPNFIYWAMKGMALPITGSGEETRDFTYVGDIVDGLLRAGVSEQAIGEEFNLASGKETRIIDLAGMINDATSNPAGVRFLERRKWDTWSRRRAEVHRARELIGYTPQVSLEEGLRHTIQWYREHWDKIQSAAHFRPEA